MASAFLIHRCDELVTSPSIVVFSLSALEADIRTKCLLELGQVIWGFVVRALHRDERELRDRLESAKTRVYRFDQKKISFAYP